MRQSYSCFNESTLCVSTKVFLHCASFIMYMIWGRQCHRLRNNTMAIYLLPGHDKLPRYLGRHIRLTCALGNHSQDELEIRVTVFSLSHEQSVYQEDRVLGVCVREGEFCLEASSEWDGHTCGSTDTDFPFSMDSELVSFGCSRWAAYRNG